MIMQKFLSPHILKNTLKCKLLNFVEKIHFNILLITFFFSFYLFTEKVTKNIGLITFL